MAEGTDEPPPPSRLPFPSSALSHHQLLFSFLGVISPLGRPAITSLSRSLIPDTPLMQLVHIWECVHVWKEGKYGSMHQRDTVRLSISQWMKVNKHVLMKHPWGKLIV